MIDTIAYAIGWLVVNTFWLISWIFTLIGYGLFIGFIGLVIYALLMGLKNYFFDTVFKLIVCAAIGIAISQSVRIYVQSVGVEKVNGWWSING